MQHPAPAPHRLLAPALALLLLVIALPLRLHALGGFVTLDEVSFWFDRADRFRLAIEVGNYADTAISSHPGVTTMWLGALGIWLRDGLWAAGWLHDASYATAVAFYRLPAALVHTGAVLLGYGLLRRMLPTGAALLAAVLWAADPFLLGFSRILHVDALMTSFATLSLLATCVYWHHGRQIGYLLLAAGCAGLAMLSKSPALILLPLVALIAVLAAHATTAPLRRLLREGLIYSGTLLLTLLLVYPAVWANPVGALDLIRFGVAAEGAAPHMQGNFFLGQVVEAPGLRFYPVALALRSTPLTLIGLLLLPLVWWAQQLPAATRRDLAVLVGFVLLFTLAMSIFPKKFNRYLVMVAPAVAILAAVGLHGAVQWLASRPRFARLPHLQPALLGMLGGLAVLNAWWWHPYPVVAFNQLLGGAPAGARSFVISWGEGMDQVAAWLNQQPDITGVRVASTMRKPLQPYLTDGAQTSSADTGTLPEQTGYVVIDVSYPQRERLREPFTSFYEQAVPVHTVALHGVAYAWIYQVPPAIATPTNALFGGQVRLQGYAIEQPAPDDLRLLVQWQAQQPIANDYLLFAHLYNQQGQRIAQIDVPPAGAEQPTSTWQVGRYLRWQHPLPLPADLPTGDYWLALGLYDPANFARLPILAPLADAPPPTAAPDAGGNALLLPITLEAQP